jgi:hypothetical protein
MNLHIEDISGYSKVLNGLYEGATISMFPLVDDRASPVTAERYLKQVTLNQ